MDDSRRSWPVLVVTSGEDAGRSVALVGGDVVIGRHPSADVQLADVTVSGRHAVIRVRGDELELEDLGSSNGSLVNGDEVTGPVALVPGDVLHLGAVELQLGTVGSSGASSPPPVHAVEDIDGPVNLGSGYQNTGPGSQLVGQFYGDQVDLDYDPLDELFQGRGAGRLLMLVGVLAAAGGLALWFLLFFSAAGAPGGPGPFEREWLGLPAGAVAFSLFGAGGLVAAVGGSMSRAARKREERRVRTGEGWPA